MKLKNFVEQIFSDYVWTSSLTVNFTERMILRRITGREELGHGILLSQYSVRQNTGAATADNSVFLRDYVVTRKNVVGLQGLEPL
jgi:hypothetical protein